MLPQGLIHNYFKEETYMKKIIALILALVLCVGLVACGGPAAGESKAPASSAPEASQPADPVEDSDGLKYLTAGQKYPAETIRIGVPLYDTTDSSAMATFSGAAPTFRAISDRRGSRFSSFCSASRACMEW